MEITNYVFVEVYTKSLDCRCRHFSVTLSRYCAASSILLAVGLVGLYCGVSHISDCSCAWYTGDMGQFITLTRTNTSVNLYTFALPLDTLRIISQ